MKLTNKILGFAFIALALWILVLMISLKVSIQRNEDHSHAFTSGTTISAMNIEHAAIV